MDPDPAFNFDLDPYCFKEVIYLKQYFLHTFTCFSLSVGPTGPTQKVFFVKFSLPFLIFVPLEKLKDPDPRHPRERIRIRILKNYAILTDRIRNTASICTYAHVHVLVYVLMSMYINICTSTCTDLHVQYLYIN
jgi:hypothetical protein